MSKHIYIYNDSHPLSTPLMAFFCKSFFCRLRGLMLRRLHKDESLLLVQPRDSKIDSSIHMFFMFMDLAVIWINSHNIVVDRILARAWNPIYIPRKAAKYVLEMHPTRFEEFTTGDRVRFENA